MVECSWDSRKESTRVGRDVVLLLLQGADLTVKAVESGSGQNRTMESGSGQNWKKPWQFQWQEVSSIRRSPCLFVENSVSVVDNC